MQETNENVQEWNCNLLSTKIVVPVALAAVGVTAIAVAIVLMKRQADAIFGHEDAEVENFDIVGNLPFFNRTHNR